MNPQFKANDGELFDTEKEAINHNKFLEAKEALDTAIDNFRRVSVGTHKTADGKPIDKEGIWSDYWIITDRYWSLRPSIVRVTIWPTSVQAIHIKDDDIEFCICIYPGGINSEHKYSHVNLSDMYSTEDAAKTALVDLLRKDLKIIESQIDEIVPPVWLPVPLEEEIDKAMRVLLESPDCESECFHFIESAVQMQIALTPDREGDDG